jgi:hypothetical protein
MLWAVCHSCQVDKSVAADAFLRLGLGLVHLILTKGGGGSLSRECPSHEAVNG